MRKLIFNLHLYAGLVSGLVLIVVSVTGCLLVFERTMDAWLNRGISYVEPQSRPLPFGTLLKSLRAEVPSKSVTELDLGGTNDSVVAVMNDRSRAYVNGYTGNLLGIRKGLQPSFYIRQLHKALLAGKMGSQIVTAATFILLFQSLSGLYLWWPLKRVNVKLLASWRRINFDLHHSVGFFSSLFVCILCITGVVRFYPNVTRAFGRATAHTPAVITAPATKNRTAGDSKITIDEAVSITEAELPGARLVRINIPDGKDGPFVVSARYPGDTSPFGLSWVELDAQTGRLLARKDFRAETEAERLQRLDRSVHVGEVFGAPTRIIAVLSCLAVLVQVVTGFFMWWKRAKKPARPAGQRLPTLEKRYEAVRSTVESETGVGRRWKAGQG